jgi:hypothetical protein
MKLKLVMVVLTLSTLALAQHGSGGGRPAGAGAPTMGGGSSHASGMGSDMGSNHASGNQQQTPTNSGRTPSEVLTQNTKLSSNLEKLLPPGTTAQQACAGFRNLGQCVAAIHVSHNLGISFDDLKAKMTGSGSDSLGKAIGALNPKVDAKAESKKAQKQADQDLKSSS